MMLSNRVVCLDETALHARPVVCNFFAALVPDQWAVRAIDLLLPIPC